MSLIDQLLKRMFVAALLFALGAVVPFSYWNLQRRADERLEFLATGMLEHLKAQSLEGDLVSLQRLFTASALALRNAGEPVEVRLSRVADGKLIANLPSAEPIVLPIQRTTNLDAIGFGEMELSIRLDSSRLILEHTVAGVTLIVFVSILFVLMRRRLMKIRNKIIALEVDGALGKLATQFAHDVRSPLSALQMVLFKLKAEQPELADLTEKAVRRIETIGENLLSEYRHERSNFSPQALKDLESEIESRYPGRATWLVSLSNFNSRFSAAELCRILQNLVLNSLEAAPDTQVAIRLVDSRTNLKIEVSDTGSGFSPEVLSALQAGLYFSTKTGGTGLGLRSVIESVASAAGTIRFLNGKSGAIVRITLPIND